MLPVLRAIKIFLAHQGFPRGFEICDNISNPDMSALSSPVSPITPVFRAANKEGIYMFKSY